MGKDPLAVRDAFVAAICATILGAISLVLLSYKIYWGIILIGIFVGTFLDVEDCRKINQFYRHALRKGLDNGDAIWAQLGVALSSIELGFDPNEEAAIETIIADFIDQADFSWVISCIEEEYYRKIMEPDPDNIYFAKAVGLWEKVLEAKPEFFFEDDPDPYYFIGDCYRHLEKYETAILYYNIVAANWAKNGYAPVSHVVVPEAVDGPGDYGVIHKVVDRLMDDFGQEPGLAGLILRTGYEYRKRANRYREEGLDADATVDNFKAIALYDRVIREFPASAFTASAYFFSALAYRDLGQEQEAMDCCNSVVDNWPEYKYASWAGRIAQNCSEKLAEQAQ